MEELKKKIDEAMKCQFVGEVIFTEDELAKIYARANSLLRNYDYGYISYISSLEDNLLFVAMVNAITFANIQNFCNEATEILNLYRIFLK